MVSEGWPVARLKYIADCNSRVLPESTAEDFQFIYVDIGDVTQGSMHLDPNLTKFADAPSRARRLAHPGDSIVSTVRTYLRAVASVPPTTDPLVFSTGFAVLHPKRWADPRFLSWYLQGDEFVSRVEAASVGVSYPAITSSALMTLDLCLPSVDEQRSIANFLDCETAQIDTIIVKQEQLIATLRERRRAVMTSAVTRGLDRSIPLVDSGDALLGFVPATWTVLSIGRAAESLDALRVPLSSEERGDRRGDYPYYGASGVIDSVDDFLFEEPLVLVSEDGANLLARSTPVAFAAYGRYWVNNHAHVLRPRSGPVGYWASRLEAIDVSPVVTGSAQPKLTAEALRALRVAVPSVHVMDEIMAHLDQQTTKIDRLIGKAVQFIALAKERRSALITAAVTGQIDVVEAA